VAAPNKLAVSTKNRSGRYSEIERREAIARERADQQVCSVRWDAWPVAFAVPPALMVPATTSVISPSGHCWSPKEHCEAEMPPGSAVFVRWDEYLLG
jgi:hypothetical protein